MGGIPISGPLVRKYSSDTYPTHLEWLAQGGYRSVATTSDLNLTTIPLDVRKKLMIVGVHNVSGKPILYWLNCPDSSASSLSNDTYWEPIPIGQNLQGGIVFKGFVNGDTGLTSNGYTLAESPLTPSDVQAGWFWIVDNAGTHDYGSGDITSAVSDWIVYDNAQYRKLAQSSPTDWYTITSMPSVIYNLGEGNISYVEDAASDGKIYARKNAAWEDITVTADQYAIVTSDGAGWVDLSELYGIGTDFYMGSTTSSGSVRKTYARGSGSEIDLEVIPKGTTGKFKISKDSSLRKTSITLKEQMMRYIK